MQTLADQINVDKLPKHIAIIMDGNGRWAKEKGQDRLYGHLHGVESVRIITECAARLGVQYMTLYAFSTENWDRPEEEVKGLMSLLVKTIRAEVPTLNKNNIRLQFIGDKNMLPPDAIEEMHLAEAETAKNTGLILILALSYSGRWEIQNAIRSIAQNVMDGALEVQAIDDEVIHQHLTTSAFPDPELMIRTSGEYRISNFLLYQIAYAELYFTDTLWPDFREEHFYKALLDYQSRERRFGKTGDQI